MSVSTQRVFARLTGKKSSSAATTDDLQGLLLQVVFALLMIFMIAYFIFVDQQKKVRAEEVMALNRQKLTLALEKVAEARRVRYGINALLVQGVDGKRVFDPDTIVVGLSVSLTPAAKQAFAQGGRAAFSDYVDRAATTAAWRDEVFAEAAVAPSELNDEEVAWFDAALATEVENVRLDVRGVQRALAARLQRAWIDDPSAFADTIDPRTLAERIKQKSLAAVAAEIGSEVLP